MAAEIEAIARAWMAHQGYTEQDVLTAEQQTCQNMGCEFDGQQWDCYYGEDGESPHPLGDALTEACAIARVAVEALEGLGWGPGQRRKCGDPQCPDWQFGSHSHTPPGGQPPATPGAVECVCGHKYAAHHARTEKCWAIGCPCSQFAAIHVSLENL